MVIPYFKQETAYTCGAACFRMVLSEMGIEKSEKQISNLLKTNKKIGTWHKNLPTVAEKYKFDYVVKRDATISDLREYTKNGWRTIVCFTTKKEPHYAVIKRINWHTIYLLDPYYGRDTKYFTKRFKRLWHDHEEEKWFLAIKSNNETKTNKKKK